MHLGRFSVVLDANVLFPIYLCDSLLRLAAADLFRPHWTEDRLCEVQRNLPKADITSDKAKARIECMKAAFPEAMVDGYQYLINVMPNHEKDRHVAAAAVRCAAEVIVTENLKDFKVLPDGVESQSVDEFLTNLWGLDHSLVLEVLYSQANSYSNPPMSLFELFGAANNVCSEFHPIGA